ncbi:energy transducer TonB [Sphingosinicella sp. LY1275]|uniref:energy transducer TonB n=1 Tax=Sphingosinicella sp. LY1275 TaxID=3095379 RepID=UPI002ADEDC4C|nr:energy transducer TonB [Sphingosinicella sp. LY1275]MEA1013850.1 energy transducer TonB [Sphingosinicella sp. LY1275]
MTLKLMIFMSLIASTSVVHAAASDGVAPTGKWTVNFRDAQCVATRAYGSEKKPLFLALKAPAVGDVMQIAVMQQSYGMGASQVEADIRFDGLAPVKTAMLTFNSDYSKLRVHLLNMPAADFAPARAAQTLKVSAADFREQFALTLMDPLLQVMERCVADLRQAWNADEGQGGRAPGGTRASGNLRNIFKSSDYPDLPLHNEQTGNVRVAALIDEKGRVADCTILETSGWAMLDGQSCAIIKARAIFTPARDASGKPVKDAVIRSVTWRLRES